MCLFAYIEMILGEKVANI